MRLMITGRHVAVTPALREYIETRMERLDRYGLKLGTLQILLSVEKFHHVAEVVGVVQSRRLQAKTINHVCGQSHGRLHGLRAMRSKWFDRRSKC